MKSITTIKDPLIIDARNLNKPSERLTRFLLEGEDIIQYPASTKKIIDLLKPEAKMTLHAWHQ